MLYNFKKISWLLLIAFYSVSPPATAALKMTIKQGTIKTINLAIADVDVSSSPAGQKIVNDELGKNIASVIDNDLSGSGLFNITTREENSEKLSSFYQKPSFGNWQRLGRQFLVQTSLSTQSAAYGPNQQILIRVKLWDVAQKKNLLGENGIGLSTNRQNWRRLAHQLSDQLYTRLTGEKGYFDSRIVFIAETGSKGTRTKQLAIMDQDGGNLHTISDGRYLVLTPRFSNNLQKISYLSYEDGVPQVYILNIETGENHLIGAFDGMTFAPRFSPDDKKIIFSYEFDGASNIYVKNLTMSPSDDLGMALTSGKDINTSPCYSPDGSFITFASDRSGTQQIYVMDSNGKNPKRISYGNGEYSTPVWSPRGDYIAFTKQSDNRFYIGIVKPDGSDERLLSQSFLDEGPTWSPNGRVIAFFRQPTADDPDLSLWTVDITGNFLRKIPTPIHGSDPAWSPLSPQ